MKWVELNFSYNINSIKLLPRKDPEQRKLYLKEYYLKHKKPTKIIVEAKIIDTNEPIDTNEIDERIDTNKKPIDANETNEPNVEMSHIKQQPQENQQIHIIPLKLKEKILRSKLTRINEFILKEGSTDPLYLDILAEEYKYNLNSTLGAFEFVKFLECYFGRYF